MSDDINVNYIADVLNNKVDLSATNLNNNGKSLISGLGMPSSRYIDLTLASSGSTYTSPANGWFNIRMYSTGTQYLNIINLTSHIADERQCPWSGAVAEPKVPVRRGDVIQIYYNTAGNVDFFRFIYAEGENN